MGPVITFLGPEPPSYGRTNTRLLRGEGDLAATMISRLAILSRGLVGVIALFDSLRDLLQQ